jgi:dihydroxyacetone kinase-like protein
MTSIKKVVNNPKEVATEALEGLCLAYHGNAILLEQYAALVRSNIPNGKVAILVGGGSGHEPLFAGFIGENLADGAVCGNVFAAPSPDKILGATEAVNRGKGVLYLYGNYAGDNMSFDIASELAAASGIDTKTVRVWDDVASAPPEKIDQRRGIAGDLFVIKIAGAAASVAPDLAEAHRITAKARDLTRSLGVALAPGSIPETGEFTFQLGPDEMEIGMGLHGEQGVARQKLMPANALVDMMLERIVEDLPFQKGDRVCMLINNLGATTMMELLIVNRKARGFLADREIGVHDTLIGSYCTSQEMAGFSISLLRLDDELQRYYDMPAASFALVKGNA